MPIERRIRLPIHPPFGGMQGVVSPRGLAPNQAVAAENCWMRYGTIDVRDPFYVFSAAAVWQAGMTGSFRANESFKILYSWKFSKFGYLFLSVATYDTGAADYYVLVRNDGTQKELITFATQSAGTGTAVPVGDRVLYVIHSAPTGVNRRVLWNGSNFVAQNAGIERYVGTWSHAAWYAPPGGFPAGSVVHHRFTYFNSDQGIESGASDDEYSTYGLTDFDVDMLIPESGDSQVDKIRVYRMVEGLDDTYFLLGEYTMTSPTTYVRDTNASIDKSFDQQINLATDVPPLSQSAAWHKRRMWYAPVDQEGILVHSELDKPSNVDPLQTYQIGGKNGQVTRHLFSLGGYLFALRTSSLWAISGDGPENFASEEVHADADCIRAGWYSLLLVGNQAAFWVGNGGIFQLDGRGINKISAALDRLWATFDVENRRERVSLAWDARHELLWVCVPWYGLGASSDLFIYDPRTQAWSHADVKLNYMAGHGPWAVEMRPYGINSPNYDIIGLKTPAEPADDWRDYETTAIDWHWQTGDLDLGADGLKRFARVAMAWNPNTLADQIKLGYRLDGVGSFVYEAAMLNDKPPMIGLDVGRLATTLALRVEGSATRQTRVTRLRVDADVVGVAP
ncbi:MAG: hypothetical protein KAU28_03085 [Phycisphaerae bacterium]|nr:hypothetical protein [Phycisphaerae bacterium]